MYLIILITCHKYQYFLVYILSKLKVFDFLGSVNDIFYGMEGMFRLYGNLRDFLYSYYSEKWEMDKCKTENA